MNENKKILVTGGSGLAGSAIVRALAVRGFKNIVATYHTKNPSDCFPPGYLASDNIKFVKINLVNQEEARLFFHTEKPDYVFLAAAKVGGIMANHNHRAEFIYDNLQIQNNVIHHSYLNNVKKLIFLGSTCIYPKNAPQPIKEEYLMSDTLEYLNEPYAVAKIAGIKMCESYNLQYNTNYIAVMPTNLYGPNDNYNLQNSHFLPAFLRKMHLAQSLKEGDWDTIRDDFNKNPVDNVDGSASEEDIISILNKFGGITKNAFGNEVSISLWGTGKPRREILHSDELADACLYIMEHIDFSDLLQNASGVYSNGMVKNEIRNTQVNIGLGYDYTLFEIAMKVKEIVGFTGIIEWNTEMPDGTFQKLTDTTKLTESGWKSKISLDEGIKSTYDYYKANSYKEAVL